MSFHERFYDTQPNQADLDSFVADLEADGRLVTGKAEVVPDPYRQRGRWLVRIPTVAAGPPLRLFDSPS